MSEEVGTLTERDLVIQFRDATERKDKLKIQLAEAQKEYEVAEQKLLDALAAQGKVRSAKYEGIGFVTAIKPRLHASCSEENKDSLFKFLRESNRGDLIKETVNTRSLSSFIGERVGEGQPVPEFISWVMVPSARLYPE